MSSKGVVKWKLRYVWYQLYTIKIAKVYHFSFWQIWHKNKLSDFEDLPWSQFWRHKKGFYISLKDLSLSYPQKLKNFKKVHPWPLSAQKTDWRSNHDLAPQKGWLKVITWYFETFYCIPVIFIHFFIIAISIDFWFDQLFGNQSPSNKKFVRIYKK